MSNCVESSVAGRQQGCCGGLAFVSTIWFLASGQLVIFERDRDIEFMRPLEPTQRVPQRPQADHFVSAHVDGRTHYPNTL